MVILDISHYGKFFLAVNHLLCFLVSAKVFYKHQPLTDFICEVLNIGPQDLGNPGLLRERGRQQQLEEAVHGNNSISQLQLLLVIVSTPQGRESAEYKTLEDLNYLPYH